MKYGLVGATGKLGKEVITLFAENNHELVFTFDLQGEWIQAEPDILIDCSRPEAFGNVLSFAKNFEEHFISQGMTDRDTIETLDLAWDLLRPLPESLLKRIPQQLIEKYHKTT